MYRLTIAAACVFLLAACSQESPSSQADDGGSRVLALADLPEDDHAWAQAIVAHASNWQAIGDEPISADPYAYTACLPPTPPDDDDNPHRQRRVETDPDKTDYQLPANRFTANARAKPYFFYKADKPDLYDLPNGSFPVGSMIAKEKYDRHDDFEDGVPMNALALMVKREPGYDPDHGDWEYGYISFNKQGSINTVTRGKLATCIQCHSKRSEIDYVYRTYSPLEADKSH